LPGKFISRFPHTVYVKKTRFLPAYAPAKTARFDYYIIAILFLTLITIAGCVKKPFPKPTPQMNTDPSLWVKVLLLDNIKSCTIKVDYPFKITNSQNDKTILLLKSPPKTINIEINAGNINIPGQNLNAKNLIIEPQSPSIFTINDNDYRGQLKLMVNHNGQDFDAINLVPLEPYLAGVIAAEMPDYWETAAIKAQTIAARTYCSYIKNRFGVNRPWDIKKTAAHQLYKGIKVESSAVWKAIEQTRGLVLVNKKDEKIFPAYYSAVCGGHTENSKNVFGGKSIEPLKGVPCPYCKQVARPSLFFWPTAEFDKDTVGRKLIEKYPKLKKLGKIKKIIPTKKSDLGNFSRVTFIKLIGSTGKFDYIRAEDLRLTIDPSGNKIRSTIFRIAQNSKKWIFKSGRGYGHGVGLCQCGAQAMARKGISAKQILLYYYPGSELKNLY